MEQKLVNFQSLALPILNTMFLLSKRQKKELKQEFAEQSDGFAEAQLQP